MTEQPNVRLKAWNDQAFCANYGDEAVWKEGLRGFAVYRDLGVEEATNGAARRSSLPTMFASSLGSAPLAGPGCARIIKYVRTWMRETGSGRGRSRTC